MISETVTVYPYLQFCPFCLFLIRSWLWSLLSLLQHFIYIILLLQQLLKSFLFLQDVYPITSMPPSNPSGNPSHPFLSDSSHRNLNPHILQQLCLRTDHKPNRPIATTADKFPIHLRHRLPSRRPEQHKHLPQPTQRHRPDLEHHPRYLRAKLVK